ncbi:MAG: DUF1559 domain-containing protein [Planctomycetes bacterium]|nr:DUF1559 domain-containing protein [Planctomycetota bacterium]
MHIYPSFRILACTGLAMLLLASIGSAQDPKLPEGLRHVPPDALGFVHIRVGDFFKSPTGKSLLQEIKADRDVAKGLNEIEQAFGASIADVESVTILMLKPERRFLMDQWDGPRFGPKGRDWDMKKPVDVEPKKAAIEAEMRREKAKAIQRLLEEELRKRDEKLRDKKKDESKESPVLFQDSDYQALARGHVEHSMNFVAFQRGMGFDHGEFSPPGFLVIVTSSRAWDRKKILQRQMLALMARDFPPSRRTESPPVLFVSDRSIMVGEPFGLLQYVDLMARNPGPTPMQAALALGAEKHLVLAGGYLPADLRGMLFGLGNFEGRLLAPLAPLLQTEAAATLDLSDGDLGLQFTAPTERSAASAVQALKSTRVLGELALEKGFEPAGPGGVNAEHLKALTKALADAAIEQKGKTVHARLKIGPDAKFHKEFAKGFITGFRQGRGRTQHVNNLKQMALGIHNYHDAFKQLPAAAISSRKNRDGKPLLSWRVAILPFLDQDPLYRKFDLDQPWDHPTNKALIPLMPDVYIMPGVDAKEGMTHYRTLVGRGTMLEPINVNGFLKTRYNLANVPDGISNCIMIVEAKDPTIWTRPDDLPYDPKGPLPKFGVWKDGFRVAMGDGRVQFVRSSVSEASLRYAIVCDDAMNAGADF